MASVYVAGPMRGWPNSNFHLFDKARDLLRRQGWAVISPADIDRANGDSGLAGEEVGVGGGDPPWVRKFIKRDVDVIINHLKAEDGDAVALLPGCRRSDGCLGEYHLARWAKLKIISGISGLVYSHRPDPMGEVDDEFLREIVAPSVGCGCSFPLPTMADIKAQADRIANTPLEEFRANTPSERFANHLKAASETVRTWPVEKQNLLGRTEAQATPARVLQLMGDLSAKQHLDKFDI